MKIIKSVKEIQSLMKKERAKGKTIGFVPTMGFLHEGHASLLSKSRQDNEISVLSIFVNPTQFGPNEDFESYPRDFKRDEILAKKMGVDYIFYPSVEEMYPNEISVSLSVVKRTNVLCGAKREGHFDGVATVVTKLFNIITPDRAYFGLKDAQQVAVLEGLVADFNFPVKIVRIPIVREEDGLAKSSRNVYLTETERKEAPAIYHALQYGKKSIEEGQKNREEIEQIVTNYLQENTSGEIDYVSCLTYPSLEKTEVVQGEMIIAVAVKYSKARLIDNIIINA